MTSYNKKVLQNIALMSRTFVSSWLYGTLSHFTRLTILPCGCNWRGTGFLYHLLSLTDFTVYSLKFGSAILLPSSLSWSYFLYCSIQHLNNSLRRDYVPVKILIHSVSLLYVYSSSFLCVNFTHFDRAVQLFLYWPAVTLRNFQVY